MSHERYTGRPQRVRDYLADHPEGATGRELIVAVEPGCKPNNMAATIAGMVASNKLRADASNGRTRYFVTANANVDRRVLANAVGKRRKPAAGRTPTQIAAARREADRRADSRAKASKRTRPTSAIRPAMSRESPLSPDLRPATSPIEGAETVAQYLARGGGIQRLRNGDMAHASAARQHPIQVPKQVPGAT